MNQFRCFISCVPNNKSVKIETTTTGAIAVSVSALPQQGFIRCNYLNHKQTLNYLVISTFFLFSSLV